VYIKSQNFRKFYSDFKNTAILPVRSLGLWDNEWARDHILKFLTKHGSCISLLEIHVVGDIQDNMLWPEVPMKKLQLICSLVPNLTRLNLIIEFGELEIFPDMFTFEEFEVTLPHVKSLYLCSDTTLPKEFLDGFFTMLPNVRSIEVLGDNDHVVPQDWEAFVNAMVKLNVHTFEHSMTSRNVEQPDIWIAMAQNRLLKLNNVSMSLEMDDEEDGGGGQEVMMAQEDFLKSQSKNLEVLSIDVPKIDRNPINFRIKLPAMEKLKEATFNYRNSGDNAGYYPVAPLKPEQLPELKTLHINPTAIFRGLFPALSLFPSVQEIEFFDWGNTCFPAQIVTKFPNLRKLTNIKVSKNLYDMENIFTYFGSIEDLELKIVDNYDRATHDFNLAVSGIPGPVETSWALSQLAERVGYEALLSWIEPPQSSLRDLKRKSCIFVCIAAMCA